MSKMSEKVAYLKGLAEGLGVSGESREDKLMLAVIDALEAFAQQSEETGGKLDELEQYVGEIDSDVSDLEEVIFSEDDDDELDEDDEDDEEGGGEDDGLIEYECPHCGTVIFFDEEAFDMEEEHLCPNCHRPVFDEDGEQGGDDDSDDE